MAADKVTRFRATWPGGSVEHHELPAESAAAFADQLRCIGLRITWYPAPPPPEPARPSRRERKADKRAGREQARQLAELVA